MEARILITDDEARTFLRGPQKTAPAISACDHGHSSARWRYVIVGERMIPTVPNDGEKSLVVDLKRDTVGSFQLATKAFRDLNKQAQFPKVVIDDAEAFGWVSTATQQEGIYLNTKGLTIFLIYAQLDPARPPATMPAFEELAGLANKIAERVGSRL